MPRVIPDYPAPVVRNAGAERELTMMRWGHAAAAEVRRAARHEHPQYLVAALARLVEAGKPVPSFDLLCVRAIGRCGVE
jgi:hypothetical protein